MIIGTAGHIDHGKSALVTALTGRAMDRLVEEKRRGITIDLNFAPLIFEGLPPAGIVDVPGHEDFVRTMVAGASGIDLVLLVVDAAQGPQPQTWEHLAIVEQLGVRRGIPVVTKADLAEPDWLELVMEELKERLAHSPVAFADPQLVSATTGQGIPELKGRLREELQAAANLPPPDEGDGFRMPVDRAFSIAGVGTVLTGTPWSGMLRVGEQVRLLPSGVRARVRSLEAYGRPVALGRPGQRAAVGLAGLARDTIRRGEMLVDDRLPWRAASALDAELRILPGIGIRRRLRVRVHLGTAEALARVYPRGEGAGGRYLARLALESPLVARGGDRFVLRSYSPVSTIGGGTVLDPLPPRRASWPEGLGGEAGVRLAALVSRRPSGVAIEDLPQLLGLPPSSCRDLVANEGEIAALGSQLISLAACAQLRADMLAQVGAFHRENPEAAGISLETLRHSLSGPAAVVNVLLDTEIRSGALVLRDGLVALPGFTPEEAGGEELLSRVLDAVEQAGLEPATVAELERSLGHPNLLRVLRRLAALGRVTAVQPDRFFSTSAVDHFVATLREVAQAEPVTPARLRDRIGLSRKYLIPLLEWADRSGVTKRVGDARVLG